MPCTSPLKGYVSRKGGWTAKLSEGWVDRHLEVSCGQCLDCKIERSRQWSIRIMHESQMWPISTFATLTYEKLPIGSTLVKSHVQAFIKKLRKNQHPSKIRYYACGEYGDQTLRPHYHIIIFNYWPHDAKHHLFNNKDQPLYKSEKLNSIWKHGFCTFGKVTFESASYTASYVTKKITGDPAKNHYKGRAPEFALMSRRPGIGKKWYEKYKHETWSSNTIVQRGQEMSPPEYYKRLLKKENPELHDILKEKSRQQMKTIWFSEWYDRITKEKKYSYHENYSKRKKDTFKKNTI